MRQTSPFAFAIALRTAASAALAGELEPYSAAAFDQRAANRNPVRLVAHADRRPTCPTQKQIVASPMKQPAFKDATTRVVDYDGDAAALKRCKIVKRSTRVVLNGGQEVGRSIADTNPAGIEAPLEKAGG